MGWAWSSQPVPERAKSGVSGKAISKENYQDATTIRMIMTPSSSSLAQTLTGSSLAGYWGRSPPTAGAWDQLGHKGTEEGDWSGGKRSSVVRQARAGNGRGRGKEQGGGDMGR